MIRAFIDGGAAMRYYGWVVAMLIVVRLGAGWPAAQNSEWVGPMLRLNTDTVRG